jgi:glycosyltransferase involved in cell wall biosynthesis
VKQKYTQDNNLKTSKTIVFAIPSIQYGGAELQVLKQVEFFLQKKFEVKLLVISDDINQGLLEKYDIPREKIFCLRAKHVSLDFRSIIKSFLLLRKVVKYFDANSIDIVIANLPITHFICRISKLFCKKKFKLILYHRSMQYAESPMDSLQKKIFNKLHSFLASKTDTQSIFISKAVFENIRNNFYVINPEIIYNAIDESEVSIESASSYCLKNGIEKKKYLIVIPGRLNEAKGQLFFIHAFKRFIAGKDLSPNDIIVILAGGGGLQQRIITEINDRNMSGYFHITGFVENSLLRSFMKLADIVIIPSLFEGLGNVAIEGLMVKSLILASDAGGLKEIVKDGYNGFTFKVGDTEDLIDKMNFLIQKKDKEFIDEETIYKSFKEKFSLPAHFEKLEMVIEAGN